MKTLQLVRSFLPLIAMLSITASAEEAEGPQAQTKSSYRTSPLVAQVRAATAVYKDVEIARANGYVETACASGPNGGAMGVHFVNPGLLFNADMSPNGEFVIETPEVLIYEPMANGKLRLVGVEFIVFRDAWDAANTDGASPVANGQLFHLGGAPNRYRLPAFYELHVWAWKWNPNGTFSDWNPKVSCEPYGTN